MAKLKINLSEIPDRHLEKIQQIFIAYANGQDLRAPVRDFFAALADFFEVVTDLRATLDLKAGEVTVELPGISNFSPVELTVFKRAFTTWRDNFAKLNPAVGELFNDFAILLDDQLYENQKGGDVFKILYGDDDDDNWEATVDG